MPLDLHMEMRHQVLIQYTVYNIEWQEQNKHQGRADCPDFDTIHTNPPRSNYLSF